MAELLSSFTTAHVGAGARARVVIPSLAARTALNPRPAIAPAFTFIYKIATVVNFTSRIRLHSVEFRVLCQARVIVMPTQMALRSTTASHARQNIVCLVFLQRSRYCNKL